MTEETDDVTTVALACQGGGAHSAFCAGALQRLLTDLPDGYEILGFSGTSGGALSATTAWFGYVDEGPDRAAELLDTLWADIAASTPVDWAINSAARWAVALDESGVPMPETSPYATPATDLAQRDLRRSIERVVDFERVPSLADGESPRLLVSAVDVTTGEFSVFSGGDVTADALLASAAVPSLFEAVEVDGRPHWDGMFAQNPPVKNFLSDVEAAEEKPDEIWVLRVTAAGREDVPTSLAAIADRRSELSGNRSLRQELAFVERVNEWLDEGALDDDRYKRVVVEQLRLDEELSYSSRFDRSPTFIEDLFEAGRAEASALLDAKAGQ
ncbi:MULTISPECIES: patatin-like phospholipase family protein [Haloarcula]|uniref:Alpha/beta hydrolase n=1 Tax=Haloarcula pellucida TaxID=1427151 RepID=A0A830GG63_9EURY|nr:MULTISPECIES: patatin-like phospholipase family protein [Halomicroarcula]MBX0346621.1 patatin-like phospholipase family protein [Halomicroarcula pellucida]MDS0277523.1 patatin-like phospholipase family protein [Halomicroarcula sp. S1AR25-4]GGN84594.1 alpha/beta hydrolase [Halomicroarcula pellucida]